MGAETAPLRARLPFARGELGLFAAGGDAAGCEGSGLDEEGGGVEEIVVAAGTRLTGDAAQLLAVLFPRQDPQMCNEDL